MCTGTAPAGWCAPLIDHGGRHLFHPAAVAAQVILAVAGLVAVAAAIGSGQAVHLRVSPAQIPAVIGLSLAAVAVHEFAHALVVVHYRRQVDAAGIRLHLGTLAFYVQATGALLLTRRQRLIQAAAGVWAEWLFTAVTALVLWLAPWPPAAPIVHRFVLLNAVTIASNLLPFTGLDGSWLLADALRMPDLARALPRLGHPADHRPGGQDPGHRRGLAAGRLPRPQRHRRRRPARHRRVLLVPAVRRPGRRPDPARPGRLAGPGRRRGDPHPARPDRRGPPAARGRRGRPRPVPGDRLPPAVALAHPRHPPPRRHHPPARQPHPLCTVAQDDDVGAGLRH